MKPIYKRTRHSIILPGLLLLLAILVVDILSHLGFAVYFWYLGVLLFFMLTNNKKLVAFSGVTSIIFIILGYYLSVGHPFDFKNYPIVNRMLSIILIVTATFGIIRFMNKRRELNQKIQELETANKELESFNYISSHDLQEPLRKIQTYVSMVLKENNLSERNTGYLKRLSDISQQMRLLIDDLLAYSSLKQSDRNFENTNLKALINEVIADQAETIREKNARINMMVDCNAPIIRFQFHQLITNLVTNALKFTHPTRQPEVTIKSEAVLGNNQHPELLPHIKYCHLSIKDNGIGFDPKYEQRIFDFLERLHGQKYPGTGLGLPICKKIVDNHNGLIKAKGEVDQGAKFDIYIPSVQE